MPSLLLDRYQTLWFQPLPGGEVKKSCIRFQPASAVSRYALATVACDGKNNFPFSHALPYEMSAPGWIVVQAR